MILIFLVFLMLFGSKNIPDIARTLGKGMRQFREATSEIQRDIERGSRDLKNQVESETRDIRAGLEVDVMNTNSSLPQNPPVNPSGRLSEEDILAGNSTPPAPAPPVKKEEPAPSAAPAPAPAPTTTPPAPVVDIPENPSDVKPLT